MQNSKRILVAVDGSQESFRTVAYVADMVSGRRGIHVGLLHLEVPPKMLEWGGSEDPEIEDRTESERDRAYRQLGGREHVEGEVLARTFARDDRGQRHRGNGFVCAV